MKMYVCLALFLIISVVNGQNYFPIKDGDVFQIRNYDEWDYFSWYTSHVSFYKVVAVEAAIGEKKYIKLNNFYFRFDSLENKLYRLIDSTDRLVFDFNKATNSKDTLYWNTYPQEYTYSGIVVNTILGKPRKTAYADYDDKMDAVYSKYTFADGFGFLSDYFFANRTEDHIFGEEIVSAVIGGEPVNPITIGIKITCKDSSIFNNSVTYPQNGYY